MSLISRRLLKQKTRLKPGDKKLETKTPLTQKEPLPAPKKEIRKRSKKTTELYTRRIPFVKKLLKQYPMCQIEWDRNCWGRATEVHEVISRGRGGKITEGYNTFLVSCHRCHYMITTNPAEAKRRGFSK